MQKADLQAAMWRIGHFLDTLEVRFWIPTEQDVIYMQVGSGDQLDGSSDENSVPYDGYIDYKISSWNESENCFAEGDGGLFEFVSDIHDRMFGILVSRCYYTLIDIYGRDKVEDARFRIQILAD